MSTKLTFAAALLGATFLAGTAMAQDAGSFVPKSAGTFMVRARIIDVLPENNSSSVSLIKGRVSATNSFTPEVDLSYFLTDNIAAELIAATTTHHVSAKGTALGKVDVGSVAVLPPTLTLQYHFLHAERFSPYVGAGINYTFFYNTRPGGAPVTRFSMTNGFGEAVQVGFDYAISGRWVLNADVKQIFLSTKASINSGFIRAKTNLDPLVVGLGVGYKF